MKICIRAASCISPQQSFNHEIFNHGPAEVVTNFLKVAEPDYTGILDAKQMRRMSRIVRMGLAAAINCIKSAMLDNVDAIVTGTAYGCMEDSENFLKKIVVQDEQMLSPTSFIQSTHNTVSAQIALYLKCHAYNNTFVHRGFSFEHALIDSMLLLHENKAQHVLTGSVDEMTEFTFNVLKRFGLYKQSPVSNLELYNSSSKGSIGGEGAAFFILSANTSVHDYAWLDAVETFYAPVDAPALEQRINKFLALQNITTGDIDVVITGRNGDIKNDELFAHLHKVFFKAHAVINYKHLCGEYPTSSSFALWLAANIVQRNTLPLCFAGKVRPKRFKKILICNSYQNKYHSFMLVSAID